METSLSLIRRLAFPIFCGLAGILIAIFIGNLPHSFSSVLLSVFLIAFIMIHTLWFYKVIQPLSHNPKKLASLADAASLSFVSPVLQKEEHAQHLLTEFSFFQSLQKKLDIAHPPHVEMKSLQDNKIHLVQTHGLLSLLKDNQLEVLAQPIVNLPQKRLAFFSCIPCVTLENGVLANLNTLGESTAHLLSNQTLGQMVLFQALQFVRRHQAAYPNHGFICALPPSLYKDRYFVEEMGNFLQQTHFPFQSLIFDVPLEITEAQLNVFSHLKSQGVRFIGKWKGKELPENLEGLILPPVDFIMLPYGGLSAWLKKQPRRQGVESLHQVLQIFPQTIIFDVDKEQDLYYHLPLPFDFATGGAFGLPKPFYHIHA